MTANDILSNLLQKMGNPIVLRNASFSDDGRLRLFISTDGKKFRKSFDLTNPNSLNEAENWLREILSAHKERSID